MMKQVHMILQGKGGVGKSVIASFLTQYFQSLGQPLVCIDTDPVNASFYGYQEYGVERLDVMDGTDLDPRKFDTLVETIIQADNDTVFVIDNGASSFVALAAYLHENNLLAFLADNDCEVMLHSVVTGGQGLTDTLNGLATLLDNFPDANLTLWLNAFFGEISDGSTPFEDTPFYKGHADRFAALLTLPGVKKETTGRDLENMLKAKLSFASTRNSADFSLMARQRLKNYWDGMHTQLEAAGF